MKIRNHRIRFGNKKFKSSLPLVFHDYGGSYLKILIVFPYVRGMWGGNRIHVALSSHLSANHMVDNLSYEIYEGILDEYKKALGKGELVCLKKRKDSSFYFPYSVKYLFGGLVDFILSRKIMDMMRRNKYDAILLISSAEGWWIGFFLRKLKRNGNLLICMHQTDPPLGIDLDFYETKKSKNTISLLKNLLMIRFQKMRLRYFDLFFGQSSWTNRIMEKFYSIKPVGVSGAIDLDSFVLDNSQNAEIQPYVAVPTAALDSDKIRIIQNLSKEGIELIAYGPVNIPGIINEGFVSDERLKEILGKAKVTLFLFDYEGLGLIPFESLAMGTPVVTERKQGPGSELVSNPYVKFVEDQNNLAVLLRAYLKANLTYENRTKIRNSIEMYSYKRFAERVETLLKDNLDSQTGV